VTGAVRRLCALAALFAPERAPALVARVAGAPPGAGAEAARLVAAARRERLHALAEVLELARGAAPDPRALAAAERPRVAEVLLAVGAGTPAGVAAPALVRLCLERLCCGGGPATAPCTSP
jgi:hypothetical protein